MNRTFLLRAARLASAGLVASLLIAAPRPVHATDDPASMEAADEASSWVAQLRAHKQAIEDARAAKLEADAAYSRGHRNNRLRGEEKSEVVTDREQLAAELERLENEWPDLLEKARQAGVSRGALREFEDD